MDINNSRRQFVLRSGQGLVAIQLLPGCSPYYRPERGEAFAPWDYPDDDMSMPLRLVHAGILASNPHNTQPWLFEVSASHIDLRADLSRTLGTVDPYLRELHLGLGAAIENIMLAAEAEPVNAELTWTPDEEEGLVARIELEAGGPSRASELYEAIPNRHTNRGPYGDFDLDPGIESALNDLLEPDTTHLVRLTDAAYSQWRDQTVQATKDFVDSELNVDSHKWFRHSLDDITENRDGITTDAAGLGAGIRFFGKISRPFDAERSGKYWIRSTEETHVVSGSGFFALCCTNRHDQLQQLEAGRSWQRLHLWCAANGIDVHPINQLIEMADNEITHGLEPRYQSVIENIVPEGSDPQMFFRVGYGWNDAFASPRRPVEWVVEEVLE